MARKVIPDGEPMSPSTDYRRRLAAGLVKPKFRYPFNEHFIDRWSDELAWLLGVIWSDGCLFNNSVEICSIDHDLLEQVEAVIGMKRGIRIKNNGRALRIVFTSKRVAAYLRNLGLTEAKSLTANFPDIPSEYEAAFLRGLLDGDGSVQEHKWRSGQQSMDIHVEWVGASPYLRDGLTACLERHGIAFTSGISHDRVWRVSVRRQDSLRRLHALLYPNYDDCYLVRKRAIFEQWIQTPRARSGRPRK